MKKLVLLILSFSILAIKAQTVWETDFGLPDSTFAIDIQQTSDGNYLLYGGIYDNSPEPNAFLVKFDEAGQEVWLSSYAMKPNAYAINPNYAHQPFGSLLQASNGDLIICGEKIIRVTSDGELVWTINSKARDVVETLAGELISVDYSVIQKYSEDGILLAWDTIGIDRQVMLDSANVLTGTFGPPGSLEAMDSFTSLELFGDNSIALTGIRYSDEPFHPNFYWFGTVTRIIDISTLDSLHSFYHPMDVALAEVPSTLDGPKIFTDSDSGQNTYVSLFPEVPQSVLITDGSFNGMNWEEVAHLESMILNYDYASTLDLYLSHYQIYNGALFASCSLSDWIDEFEYRGEHVLEYNEEYLVQSLNKVYVGSIEEEDGMHAFLIDSNNRYFFSGLRDFSVEQFSAPPLWSDEPGSFFVARIDSLQSPVEVGEITGTVFLDINSDGDRDENEPGLPNVRIESNLEFASYTNSNGNYQVFLDGPDLYSLSINPVLLDIGEFTITTDYPLEVDVDQLQFGLYSADFGVHLDSIFIKGQLFGAGANPGFGFNLWHSIDGLFPLGYDSINCVLSYESENLTFEGSNVGVEESGSELLWTLFPAEFEQLVNDGGLIQFLVDPAATGSLQFGLTLTAHHSGISTQDYQTLNVEITGSFDPNDKLVEPAGIGPDGLIPPDTERLTYTIRFQNTGTDTTHFIRIYDEIDTEYLDMSGFQMLASSHDGYELNYIDGELHWRWDPIYLPDSMTDPLGSQGFVQFSIPLRDDAQAGDIIQNDAAIYFDFNEPVITEPVTNTLYACGMADLQATDEYCVGDFLDAENIGVDGTNTWSLDFAEYEQEEAPLFIFTEPDTVRLQLEVFDNTCNTTSIDSLLLIVHGNPIGSQINQNVNTLSVSSVYEVQWYQDGLPIPEADDLQYEISEDGDYQVEFISAHCSSFSAIYSAEFIICGSAILSGQVDYCRGETLNVENLGQDATNTWTIEGQGSFPQNDAPELVLEEAGDFWLYLLVEDSICTSSSLDSVLLTITETPMASTIIQIGNTLSVSTDLSVQWYLDGTMIFGANDTTYLITEEGDYQVEFFNGLCSSFSDVFPAVVSGLADLVKEGQVTLIRQADIVELSWSEELEISSIRLMDARGRLVEEQIVENQYQTQFDLSQISQGMNLLVFDKNGDVIGVSRIVR
jgi:hypothetical protein